MTAQSAIAITGASGELGRRVAARLAERGVRQRLVVRSAARAPSVPNAEVIEASDYGDLAAMERALRGVETVFLISADLAPDRVRLHTTAADAAIAAGAQRIVYLSFLSAAPNATFTAARDHFRTEQHIRATGVPFTFLRSSLYGDDVAGWFGDGGVLRGPAGEGRVSWTNREDIADVAAEVLTGSGHAGQTYDMTGPDAITLAETAAMLSELTGRKLSYYAETIGEAKASRAHYGAPEHEVMAWISSYLAIQTGEMSTASGDVARVTGHPPTPLAEFLRHHPESYQNLVR